MAHNGQRQHMVPLYFEAFPSRVEASLGMAVLADKVCFGSFV